MDSYEHYANVRPPIFRVAAQPSNFIRDVPREVFARDTPGTNAQGHSVLINNLNPMISKEDIQVSEHNHR
jgi:hypothetical protein